MINKAEDAFWLIKYLNITIRVADELQEKRHDDHVEQPCEEAKKVTQVAW